VNYKSKRDLVGNFVA